MRCALRVLPLLSLLAALGCGAGGVGVRKADSPTLAAAWQASALTESQASPRTRQTLRQYDLESLYPGDLDGIAAKLHEQAAKDPLPGVLFALAEIHYLRAERLHRQPAEACAAYYLSAGCAYHHLFGETRPDPFDPRFRIACDLYNTSLARLIRAAQAIGHLDLRGGLYLPGDPPIKLTIKHGGFDWRPEEFGPVHLAADYRVIGLANQHRTYGLGVPLIGTRDPDAPCPHHGFHPKKACFPVTAFFRFDGKLEDLCRRRDGTLELVNPLDCRTATVKGRRVPLETDLTTPLAFFLAGAKLENAGLAGFLRPDSLKGATGLHALQPYRPGKIPVVLVHGLLSSPLTWAPMYNDLQADPRLRDRFQFWVYFYPTGNPYISSAAHLRRELDRLRNRLDPEGKDPALGEMVFVGHSMGGLVSRLLTVEGGDDFWKLVADAPLDGLRVAEGTRSELRNTFYFERQRFVTRVIYLGTPHKGSRLSPSPLGRLAARLAGVPKQLMDATKDVLDDNPGASAWSKHVPTSVDLLDPGSPALQLIGDRPRPAGVNYHSVIGISSRRRLVVERLFGGGYWRDSDGVVPYDSAHLDGADSELVVPADHYTVHQHALAILEVRRILLEHLRAFDEKHQPIQRVKGEIREKQVGDRPPGR